MGEIAPSASRTFLKPPGPPKNPGSPTFRDKNSNQQLRFITLIDIFYEKNISLTLSLEVDFNNLSSSQKHLSIFKRTKSRLFEMTKVDF